MADTSGPSSCSIFYYRYDSPLLINYDASFFTIHCTLEKGAEAYYSGVRVVMIAKKIGYDDNFAKAEIRVRHLAAKKHVRIEPTEETDTVIDYHALLVDGLPLYTLIFEIVDLSDATWSGAEIRFQAAAETSGPGPLQQIPDTHRVLYDCAKRRTGHSLSCFLPLATRNVEFRSRYRRKPVRYPVKVSSIALPTHGFRILPPSERRPVFTQPPPEILYHIFFVLRAHDGGYSGYSESWLKALVTASLVCRAWWRVALCAIYEEFDFESQAQKKVHIGQLARTLKDNPEWGRHIKCFSLSHFKNRTPEARGSALTILKTASNMRRLSVGDVSAALADGFVEAFCKMSELRYFVQFSRPGSRGTTWYNDPDPDTFLNAAQLTKCFAHWPKLRQATVEQIGRPLAEDNGLALIPAQCTLNQIEFGRGFVSMAQLRAITASSQDTLHTVVFRSIGGISNKELTSWLLDFGPTLTNLTLQSNIFTRLETDEHAVDATIHMMPKLAVLEIDGSAVTVLTLLRFNSMEPGRQRIQIGAPMQIHLHAFVIALQTTKWKSVSVASWSISGENSELVKEAKKVAKERGIYLSM